jgi:division protein CdvB (Snf7/Vps24/ESCRT-III family)
VGRDALVKRLKWNKESRASSDFKIKDCGKLSDGWKQQISLVTQRIDVQTRSLDAAVDRFQRRDSGIFNHIVKALEDRDEARANILSTELSEIRKIEKMLTHASIALQSVSMRLSTVSEMGDIVAVLSPAKSVLNDIRSEMTSILPEAGQELGNIGNLISDIVGSTNQSANVHVDLGKTSPEAEKILQEAEWAAEKRLEDKLPGVEMGKNLQKVNLDS